MMSQEAWSMAKKDLEPDRPLRISVRPRRGGRLLPKDSFAPITEPFLPDPFPRKAGDNRAQLVDDFGFLDALAKQAVESCAGFVATEVNLILAGSFADESDLRHIRPRTAVGATRHADDDLFLAQAQLGQQRLHSAQ